MSVRIKLMIDQDGRRFFIVPIVDTYGCRGIRIMHDGHAAVYSLEQLFNEESSWDT